MDQTHRAMPDEILQKEHWMRGSMCQQPALNFKQLFSALVFFFTAFKFSDLVIKTSVDRWFSLEVTFKPAMSKICSLKLSKLKYIWCIFDYLGCMFALVVTGFICGLLTVWLIQVFSLKHLQQPGEAWPTYFSATACRIGYAIVWSPPADDKTSFFISDPWSNNFIRLSTQVIIAQTLHSSLWLL